jgi:hypothetical protein
MVLSHRIQETAPQRNRRILLAAWDRGVTVQSHWAGRYNVTSGTQTGVLHEVVTWRDGDFNMHEACSCPWGTQARGSGHIQRRDRAGARRGRPVRAHS